MKMKKSKKQIRKEREMLKIFEEIPKKEEEIEEAEEKHELLGKVKEIVYGFSDMGEYPDEYAIPIVVLGHLFPLIVKIGLQVTPLISPFNDKIRLRIEGAVRHYGTAELEYGILDLGAIWFSVPKKALKFIKECLEEDELAINDIEFRLKFCARKPTLDNDAVEITLDWSCIIRGGQGC